MKSFNSSHTMQQSGKNKRNPFSHVQFNGKRNGPMDGAPSPKRFHMYQNSELQANAILNHRKQLPVYKARNRLLELLKDNATSILIGETGSGKTTQIPQFLHEERLDRDGMIGITQPRRVAAISLSTRVAQEMRVVLGTLVGYHVRFEDCTSHATKVKFLTDGMLLREAMLDPLLSRYSYIILDEAHERTVNTDILFGIVKDAQKQRSSSVHHCPLKVLVMSATMDVDNFSKYFNSAPVVYLEGRQYPVEHYGLVTKEEDYVFACLVKFFEIHREMPAENHVLIFLTGQEEIDRVRVSIVDIQKEIQGQAPPLVVFPLYASLPYAQQKAVFDVPQPGTRKVVLATNIAETSVTIPGMKVVIDSGMVKAKSYHPATGLEILKVQRISHMQLFQRAGRVGRESDGMYYRMFTDEEYDEMPKDTVPEIKRCNLSTVILQMLAIGISEIEKFDFMDAPSHEAISAGLRQLHLLGAVTSVENPDLTDLGRSMSLFPLEPRFSKALISSAKYNCSHEILSIIAILSCEGILLTPPRKKEEARAVRQKYYSSEGDHITALKIFRAYRSAKNKIEWCRDYFIHVRHMTNAVNIRKQLVELCDRFRIPTTTTCGDDFEAVRRCLTTGLFTNIAERQRDGTYITLDSHQVVSIHPLSVLFGGQPHYVLFTDMVETSKRYIRDLSIADESWIEEVAPGYLKERRMNFNGGKC